ncbi:hypothetical protein L5515_010128 [Caenorhabditis briggsae]|uniref:Uncharacterized protein n=1 Tax=Caenorhabditis briggsae TaxID=6238 RepID=A0AAE9JFI6_CAEBR|nr:hypothetical protein L5515_010128 [Caenorhabditis briggsae]
MSDDAKTNVSNVVTSIKDCADVGMYTFSKMSPQLAAFVGVGLFVKNIIVSTAADPNGEVLKKLGDLKVDLKRLEESMKNGFDNLKAFILMQEFHNNIAVPAQVMCQFWSDCTGSDDQKTRQDRVQVFKETYAKHSPLELGETLMQLLSNEVTNFLKQAMSADTLMAEKTFTNCRNMIEAVFAQLWMLESFASGLVHDRDTYRPNKIYEQYERFEEVVKKWEIEYQVGSSFWPDKVRQFVEGIQDNNEEKTSEEKAQMIKEGLDKMMTNDLFYIVVCRSAYRCLLAADPADQTIASLDRKYCNVYIFRSKKGRTASDAEMKKFSEDMKKKFENVYRHRTEQNNRNAEWMLDWQVRNWRGEMENCAFMLTVRSKEYVAVRSTHTDIRERGPGDWMDGQYHAGNIFSAGETFRVVVGFQ